MADSSLDDFFAKKDKSKKKGKSKVTPNDLLEKQKVKKKKATSVKKKEESNTQVDPSKEGDEDWLEVEEEEKDYTGLRIQTLQITQEKEQEEKENEEKGSDEDDDESGEKKDVTSGPWGKVEAPAPAPAPHKLPEPEPEPVKKDDTPARPAKYIPPGARHAAAAQTQLIGPGMGPRRRGKAAPNLESEEDFPTLGAEVPVIDSAWGSGGKFEKVKGGMKQMDNPSDKGPQLSLGNKYTALQGGTD